MTIEEILQQLRGRYGDSWGREVLGYLFALDNTMGTLTLLRAAEFDLLYTWTLEMIEAGIASKQSQEE